MCGSNLQTNQKATQIKYLAKLAGSQLPGPLPRKPFTKFGAIKIFIRHLTGMLNLQYLLSLFSSSGSSSSNPFKGYVTVLLEQVQASPSAKDEEFVFPHLCGVVVLQTLLQACLLQPAVQEAEDGVYVIRPKGCQNVLLSARCQQG